MLKLNILPQSYRKELGIIDLYSTFKIVFLLIVLLTILVAIILLFGSFILDNYIAENPGFSSLSTASGYMEVDSQSEEIKDKMDYIEEMQGDFINWSKLLEKLMQDSNSGISFSRISMNQIDNNLVLVGHAQTREEIIEFKKNLEESDVYLNIDFPIQNILEKEDIDFEIEIIFDPYDFR